MGLGHAHWRLKTFNKILPSLDTKVPSLITNVEKAMDPNVWMEKYDKYQPFSIHIKQHDMIKIDDIAQMPTPCSHGIPPRACKGMDVGFHHGGERLYAFKKCLLTPSHGTLTLGSGKSQINRCRLQVLFLRLEIHFWKAASYIFPFSSQYLPP